MGIAAIPRGHGKTLLPLGKKAHLQEMIRSLDAIDSCQTHFFHQAILQRFKQPLNTPFRLRAVGRDPLDTQFLQGSPKLRAGGCSLELFGNCRGTVAAEDAVFISVMGQWTSLAPQPSAKRS